ncbi:MAG: PD-(D/E)XK nuclease-like domain-containing protein [Sulfitobacter sp.]
MPLLSQGVYFDLSDEQYHGDPCKTPSLSSTLARTLLNQSPLHAWTAHPKLNPSFQPVEKNTFDIGRAAHRSVLGRGSEYEEIPSDLLAANGAASTKAAKEWIADARARGVTPLKSDEIERVFNMAEIASRRMENNKIFLWPDNAEVVVIAEIGGVPCRAMIDNAPPEKDQPLYDFKTCENASVNACLRSVMNYGYDVQAAHYLECWKAATGEDRLFRFIFQEKSEPHEICVIELGSDSLAMASKKTARAREIWSNCIRSDYWPGYPDGVQRMELPEFFHERWLETESQTADFKRHYGRDVLDSAKRWQAPQLMAGE